jgi:hypothetical protein
LAQNHQATLAEKEEDEKVFIASLIVQSGSIKNEGVSAHQQQIKRRLKQTRDRFE